MRTFEVVQKVILFAGMTRPEDDDDGIELERETRLRESEHLSDRPPPATEEEGKAVKDDPPAKEDRGQDGS